MLLPLVTAVMVVGALLAYNSAFHLNGTEAAISRLQRVIDGDTIEATVPGYGRKRIRLATIDAPERTQPYGSESTACLRDVLSHGPLRVEPDKMDRYGRLLANLYVGDRRVDVEMVERGCAWWYARYSSSPALIKAHFCAKLNKRGLWAGTHPINPEIFRRGK